MWGQLELKKLYVEHVIIPVNQERDTKNTFNLRSLIVSYEIMLHKLFLN